MSKTTTYRWPTCTQCRRDKDTDMYRTIDEGRCIPCVERPRIKEATRLRFSATLSTVKKATDTRKAIVKLSREAQEKARERLLKRKENAERHAESARMRAEIRQDKADDLHNRITMPWEEFQRLHGAN